MRWNYCRAEQPYGVCPGLTRVSGSRAKSRNDIVDYDRAHAWNNTCALNMATPELPRERGATHWRIFFERKKGHCEYFVGVGRDAAHAGTARPHGQRFQSGTLNPVSKVRDPCVGRA
jgi:hypothetical protein